MGTIIIKIIGLIISAIGVIMLLDARYLTKKFFGFGDQNEAALGLKIVGIVLALIGGLIIYFQS